MSTLPTDAAGDKPKFSNAYRGYVLGMLVLGYIFNVVDRGVFGIVLQPIKEEFLLSDTQLGVLSGLAFAIFYAFVGIPMARLADAWSRGAFTARAWYCRNSCWGSPNPKRTN